MVVWWLNFIAARGVAPLTASTMGLRKGAARVEEAQYWKRSGAKASDQVVIATGKEACKKARPTRAGLKMLQPSPPKIIFPTRIETILPITPIQSGKAGGRVSPSSRPVSAADQSPMVGSCR